MIVLRYTKVAVQSDFYASFLAKYLEYKFSESCRYMSHYWTVHYFGCIFDSKFNKIRLRNFGNDTCKHTNKNYYVCFHLIQKRVSPRIHIYTHCSPLIDICVTYNVTLLIIAFYAWTLSLQENRELYVEIKCQLDATEVFIADLIACSTCFGHHYAHHEELKSIIQWLLRVVFCAAHAATTV